jgi:chromosomal replication initiator protein
VRDLEACLVRLGAHISLTGTTITTEMARSLLKDFISEDDRPLSVENIMKAVAEYYGIRVQDMKAKKRNRDIALPRQIAMYIARTLTDVSLAEIGKQMGGKNHATVIYAMKQIKAKREADEQFDRMIETLVQRIQQ